MSIDKGEILNKIGYMDLVYGRINKKLKKNLSRTEIENHILQLIKQVPIMNFQKKGKNFYIYNLEEKVRITINSTTFRVITVDKII